MVQLQLSLFQVLWLPFLVQAAILPNGIKRHEVSVIGHSTATIIASEPYYEAPSFVPVISEGEDSATDDSAPVFVTVTVTVIVPEPSDIASSSSSVTTVNTQSSTSSITPVPSSTSTLTTSSTSTTSRRSSTSSTTTSSSSSASPSSTQDPRPALLLSNAEAAQRQNLAFRGLSPDAQCNIGERVCLDGQVGVCDNDTSGTRTLFIPQFCGELTCFSVPKLNGQNGTDIGCLEPIEAQNRMVAAGLDSGLFGEGPIDSSGATLLRARGIVPLTAFFAILFQILA